VDTVRRAGVRARIVPTLVSLPFALLGLFGSDAWVEVAAKADEVQHRERSLVAAR
jgi:hypothetical protein